MRKKRSGLSTKKINYENESWENTDKERRGQEVKERRE